MADKKTLRKRLERLKPTNFIMLTLAGMINAVGVVLFLTPVNLYDSGISGTSVLLAQITPLSLSAFLLILNVPLFLFGLRRQGKVFTVYSIYAVAIYSVSAWLITDVLPIDVNLASPLAGTDLLLCALFGGLISGVGSGLVIRHGGAIDGVEVTAVIFAKRIGLTVGSFVMIYNVALYVIAGILLEDWILPLYSIVAYGAALKTIDFIVEGIDRAKCAMIITENPNEICAELMETFETGATKIEVVGGYSNAKKTMVYFIVNRFQVIKLKEIVHSIDKKAFITISEVADIFSANQKK